MFIWVSVMIIADIAKNGPKGIICSFFLYKTIRETGSPINEAKKIQITLIYGPKTNPNRNISFISPPPIDSFLNKKSPSFFSKNIIVKEIIPYEMANSVSFNPDLIKISMIKVTAPKISTSSGIIIV